MTSTSSTHKHVDATCYLDESGSEGEIAVVAGLVMNRKCRKAFDEHWDDLLRRYNLPYAVHMREFSNRGRLKNAVPRSRKTEFFAEITDLILRGRIVSVGAVVKRSEYETVLS